MILGQVSVSVFIDNQPLPEYQVVKYSTLEENIVTCWIASEAGKKFEIRAEILEPHYPGIKSFAFVDGVECPAWVVHPPWTGTMVYDCIPDDDSEASSCRNFMFKNIEFTDDDSALDNYSGDIGRIMVRLESGTFTKKKPVRKPRSTRSAKFKKVNGHTLRVHEGKVHERSKKGRDHRVGFGKAVPDREKQTEYESDRDDRPATVFIFNFTSLDNLRAMDLVPRMSNPPIPVDGPSDDQSSSKDMRIRDLELENQRLRAELLVTSSSSSGGQKPSPVKLEHRPEASI
ncbi:hypothetical protein EV702DRAFT_1271407 [Suillus placidus]|uniref:DUF7918 domain-containing protein n=1 Tax=Suillus placidus TaxID=48579 RepID=A0A9P7CXQ2_9AGAM|nr:hypothetical protein EV702DRAFT_1271407 [Suillus placidus]